MLQATQTGVLRMYDDIAVLKRYTTSGYDEYGNPAKMLEKVTVFVQPRGVYSSEFYDAAQLGIKPSVTLMMNNRADYSGQKIVEFQGVDYDVIRVDWNAQRDGLSLVCEERAKNNPIAPSPEESGS